MTNGDKVRQMSDEELADLFLRLSPPPVSVVFSDGRMWRDFWLDLSKQEVEE